MSHLKGLNLGTSCPLKQRSDSDACGYSTRIRYIDRDNFYRERTVSSAQKKAFSNVSLAQLKSSQEEGRGMAIAGLVLGYVSLGFWALIVIAAAVVAASS